MTGPREPYRSGGGGVPDDAPTSNIPRVDPPSPETRSFRPVEGGDAAPGTQAFPPIGSEGAPTDQPNPDPGYPPAGDPTGGDPQGPTTAWSRYPEEQQVPGGPGASGPYPPPGSGPPGPPSGTGGPGDGSGGKGFPLWRFTGAIVALLVLLGVTLWTLVDIGHDDTPQAAPASSTPTSTSRTGPSPTMQQTRASDPPSTEPAGPGERCGEYYLHKTLGAGVRARECDPDFALLEVGPGRSGLYRWESDHWEFVSDPYSGVCRDQLEEVGVPERFRRDFPPCERDAPRAPLGVPGAPALPTPGAPAPPPDGQGSGGTVDGQAGTGGGGEDNPGDDNTGDPQTKVEDPPPSSATSTSKAAAEPN